MNFQAWLHEISKQWIPHTGGEETPPLLFAAARRYAMAHRLSIHEENFCLDPFEHIRITDKIELGEFTFTVLHTTGYQSRNGEPTSGAYLLLHEGEQISGQHQLLMMELRHTPEDPEDRHARSVGKWIVATNSHRMGYVIRQVREALVPPPDEPIAREQPYR